MIRCRRMRGAILVLWIFTTAALVALTLAVGRFGWLAYAGRKTRISAEAALLSALRVRAESLERIAGRWEEIGQWIASADAAGAVVPADRQDAFEAAAKKLSGAVPGYKGRIRSALTVSLEANGISRSAVTEAVPGGLDLGVQPSAVAIQDGSVGRVVAGGYYARAWGPGERLAEFGDWAAIDVEIAVPAPFLASGSETRLRRRALGRAVWDADLLHPDVRLRGTGGFPRTWPEAVRDGRAEPHPFPWFDGIVERESHAPR